MRAVRPEKPQNAPHRGALPVPVEGVEVRTRAQLHCGPHASQAALRPVAPVRAAHFRPTARCRPPIARSGTNRGHHRGCAPDCFGNGSWTSLRGDVCGPLGVAVESWFLTFKASVGFNVEL